MGNHTHYGLDFEKKRLREQELLFHTVIKISQIKFSVLLHTSASKFLLRAPPVFYLLQPRLNFLFYIVLLIRNKILVLFGWNLEAGNSKI